MSWGFQSGHAVGVDERTYGYLHSKSTKNFFRVNDPLIDELCTKLRQTAAVADQRVITKKIVDREFDQVLRMWMPYDNGFLTFQQHVKNGPALALRAGMELAKLDRCLAEDVAAFNTICRDAGVPAVVPNARGNP